MKKILLVAFLLLFLIIGSGQAQAAGLVPCEGASCGVCDFFKLLSNIFNFAMKLVIIIGTLMLAAGGGYLLFAGANPGALETGKKIITSTIWGIVIIFAAFMIVGTVLSAIGLADWTQNIYKNWWDKGFWQPSCLTSGPSTVSTTPTPPTGETPKVLAPDDAVLSAEPISSALQDLNEKVIPGTNVQIEWHESSITSLTPNQMEKGWGEKQLARIFSFFGQNFALAEGTATQYKRAGQSAVTYTKIEVSQKPNDMIEVTAELFYDKTILHGETINQVNPSFTIWDSDKNELLWEQNLIIEPETFQNVAPNAIIQYKGSFSRMKDGNRLKYLYLYFQGTFDLSVSYHQGSIWNIDPVGLDIVGDNMPPDYIYDIYNTKNWLEFPRPTAAEVMQLVKPVRGSGIWKYYPGYGWQESLEDWNGTAWVLRKDNYGTAEKVLPNCEIPDSGWGAPSPDAAKIIKAYYETNKTSLNCASSPIIPIDLLLCENGVLSSSCTEVATNIPNRGFYVWTVSNTPGKYNIQIKNSNNVAVFQTGLFEIGATY